MMYYFSGGSRVFQTEWGEPTPEFGAKTYYLAKNVLKTAENERNWPIGGGGSANALFKVAPTVLMLSNLLILGSHSEWRHTRR